MVNQITEKLEALRPFEVNAPDERLFPAACESSPPSAPVPTFTVNLISVPLKEPFQAYGVYIDGRNDRTLIKITEGGGNKRKTIAEEHVLLVSEPGSLYLGHVTPKTSVSDDELTEMISDVPAEIEILKFPCHSQAVKRYVKLVTEASVAVCGNDARDGGADLGTFRKCIAVEKEAYMSGISISIGKRTDLVLLDETLNALNHIENIFVPLFFHIQE
ncbi:hypothetical protein ILUMI_13097 [Ignelater luminosus]|uniref:Uncharacterized protein n=1 Tax=Ignelater luminosus TaxID=2038154 RepID=A0A8K0CWV6_IGNLU|nr:hypothetical protein ILUMI_13097 [Ignelater luminosus]